MERVTRVRQVIGVSVIGLSIEQPGLDLSQILLMGEIGKSPALARLGNQGHVAGTSAYPPTGDIRWPMSVIVLISSGLPPDAMKPKDEASNSFDWFNLGQKE